MFDSENFPQMNLILLIVVLNLLKSKVLVWTDPTQKKEGCVSVHLLVMLTFFTSTALMLKVSSGPLVSDGPLALSGLNFYQFHQSWSIITPQGLSRLFFSSSIFSSFICRNICVLLAIICHLVQQSTIRVHSGPLNTDEVIKHRSN